MKLSKFKKEKIAVLFAGSLLAVSGSVAADCFSKAEESEEDCAEAYPDHGTMVGYGNGDSTHYKVCISDIQESGEHRHSVCTM